VIILLQDEVKVTNIKQYKWTTGWTIIEPFVINGETYLLSYKERDGTAAIDRITIS
jgi:hypothetical protein